MEPVIDLPALPLTGLFSMDRVHEPALGIDQSLLVCPDCGHGQLGVQVAAERLYGQSYGYRTAESPAAQRGVAQFVAGLDRLLPGQTFACALDVGCNDLYLLGQLENRAR